MGLSASAELVKKRGKNNEGWAVAACPFTVHWQLKKEGASSP